HAWVIAAIALRSRPMAERCQLCGARWDGEATTCRECGAPRRNTIPPELSAPTPVPWPPSGATPVAFAPPPSDAAPVAVAPPPSEAVPAQPAPPLVAPPLVRPSLAAPAPVPPGVPRPLRSPIRRHPLLLASAAVAGVIAIGAAAWLAKETIAPSPEEGKPITVIANDPSGCAQAEALAGSWVFTTTATGGRGKRGLGTRGYYQLEVTVDGCSARASVAKTGRTDRAVFNDRKIPRADATLIHGEGIEGFGWAGTFVLRNEDDQGIDTRFVLAVDGERLVG